VTNVLDKSKYQSAFAELFGEDDSGRVSYMKLWTRVLVYLGREGVNDVDLEDVAHDVMDRVFAKHGGGEVIQNITAYALAVARNIVREYRRRHLKHELIPISQFLHDEPDAQRFLSLPPLHSQFEQDAETDQHAKLIENCLGELEPADCELLRQYYEGSYASRVRIAADLGISLETLRVRMYRLRSRVRKRYQRGLHTSRQFLVNVERS
jgi:RNA polymerase sigma factor (sigma-70 family)